jgi:translation initiation factor IF-3
VGIVEVREAMAQAQQAGLDLVEVAPDARPPVCRIMDYGKWKYAQSKKEQRSKGHRRETALKEIRIKTPKIGQHDLQIKLGHAREFLERGDRVQFVLRFRGRELAHIDEGERVFQRVKEQLADVSKVDQDWRREGRRITMTLAPVPRKSVAAPPPAASAPPAAEKPTATEKPAAQPQDSAAQG